LKIRLFPIFVLAIFILSLALGLFYAFSYYMARSSVVEVRTVDSSRSENVFISCSAINTSYVAGGKAVFYLDVLNLGNRTIHRIDFTLRVTALSLFGFRILETNDYSTRTYVKGNTERIVIERDLPTVTPSGFFALQLSAKPEGLDPLEPCELVIYVSRSNYFMNLLLLLLVSSGTFYGLTKSAYVRRVGMESARPLYRMGASLLILIDLSMERAENKLIGVLSSFSIGQKFIFSAICILFLTAMSLTLRIQGLADQLGILAFFAISVGVVNLIWESFKEAKPLESRLPFRLQPMTSLLLYTLLIYFSLPAVSIVFLVASVLAALLVAIYSLLRTRKDRIDG